MHLFIYISKFFHSHDDDYITMCALQINRTSELARVFGIEFFSVLSRGSQYRVESMLLRLVHSQNYLAVSPGNLQV